MIQRIPCQALAARVALTIATGIVGLVLLAAASGAAMASSHETQMHLRLLDRLDRPDDGYCLDIPGPAQNMFPQLPLFAHNCSPNLKVDTAVVFDEAGFIKFPSVNLCVTVIGVKRALPGSPVMLNQCNPANPFIDISARQKFTLHDDGRLVITGSDLCLTVGPQSDETLSPIHRWRPLFVDDCATAPVNRSRWEFMVPAS